MSLVPDRENGSPSFAVSVNISDDEHNTAQVESDMALHEAHDIEAANILSRPLTLSSQEWRCAAFESEDELDAYAERLAPHRELVCPITQELMREPVVAEDGHTYERDAILRWFSVGRSRSPVTNSILRDHRVCPNLAVQTMAIAHRERLGAELLKRCEYIASHSGECEDRGARIGALLDCGADLTLRDHEGHTALLYLIQSAQLPLVELLLQHDATVNGSGDEGKEILDAAKAGKHRALFLAKRQNPQKHLLQKKWDDLISDIEQRARREKEIKEARERARAQANDQRREEQRSLAAEQRRARRNGGAGRNRDGQDGVGELQPGWGYFPSLAALQFQSSIPPPSRSVVELETREKQRLNTILRVVGFLVLLLLLFP